MTRRGVALMLGLYSNSVTDSYDAKTMDELLEIKAIREDFEYQSLYRTLQSLVGCGYVEYGINAGRSYTYFLNSKGSKFLETKIIPPDYEEEVSDDETEY